MSDPSLPPFDTETLGRAILALEAESKALQLMIALLLANNPEALAELQRILPSVGELGLAMPLLDDQLAHLQAVLSQVAEHAHVVAQQPRS